MIESNKIHVDSGGFFMEKSELEALKKEIEEVRQLINTYIEYPEIFKDELADSSVKIDMLINEYIKFINPSWSAWPE